MANMINILFWLLAGHFIGDFPFQTEWMFLNKGKSWEADFYHSAAYAFTILVIAKIGGLVISPIIILVILFSHFIIEPFKERWRIIPYIWLDQILHIFVLIIISIIIAL